MSHGKASRVLVDYIMKEASNSIIPCISTIQTHLYNNLGINDQMFITVESTYLTLLHRVYLLLFMLRYKMQIQRKRPPSNRNLGTSVFCFKGKGWYSKLMAKEQKILNDPNVIITSNPIPEDSINGMCRSDIASFKNTSHIDKLNSCMFRDNSMDSILFQQKIHNFRYIHSCNKHTHWKPSYHISTNIRTPDEKDLQEVPSMDYLREQVKLCTDGLNIKSKKNEKESWNAIFHKICEICDLESDFPPWAMSPCYSKNNICGHIQQVNLDKATTNTLYLAVLDNMTGTGSCQYPLSLPAMFIQSVVYENPVWDIELQHMIINKNSNKLFNMEIHKVRRYTTKCICPCGGFV